MKKFWLLCFIYLLLIPSSWGAWKITGDSSPADVTRLGLGTRQMGMGRAGVAMGDDSGGWLLNPAGLAGIRSMEVNTMMTRLIGAFNYYFLSYVHPAPADTFGISLLHEDPGSIPRVEELDSNGYPRDSGEVVPAGTNLIVVGYGKKWSREIYLGVAVKHMVRYLDNAHGTNTLMDIGVISTTPFKDLSLGINVVNAAQQGFRWDTGDPQITNVPVYYKLGLAWEVLNKQLTLALDDEIGNFNRLNLGAEYWLTKNLAFRCGTYGEIFTLGLGLRYGFFQLDYAYSYDTLPVEQTAFISMTFGDARESELEQPEIYILED